MHSAKRVDFRFLEFILPIPEFTKGRQKQIVERVALMCLIYCRKKCGSTNLKFMISYEDNEIKPSAWIVLFPVEGRLYALIVGPEMICACV